ARDPREIEVHQQRLAVRPGDRRVRDVRRALGLPAVDHGVRHDRDEAPLQVVAQCGEAWTERRLLLHGQLRRRAQRDDPRHVLGAGPDAELLAAAVDDRLDRLAVAYDQRTDALGGADLVAGEGEEGTAHVAQRYGDFTERLDGVGVEQDAGLATSL